MVLARLALLPFRSWLCTLFLDRRAPNGAPKVALQGKLKWGPEGR